MSRPKLLCAALVVGVALALFGPLAVVAHVRLHNPSNKAKLFWQDPESIGIVISSRGSDDIDDGSHETSIRSAIDSWNAVTGTTMRLVEDTSASEQAREDWEADDIHLIYFDEENDSGYFPSGSGTVAITPVWFFSSGKISDADILFNGNGFNFTTSKQPGRFDVEDVAAHELGHLLGLDHSGWAGGTMYPFVDPAVILHRSLSLDEVAGIRDIYPDNDFGVIRGRVLRQSDSSPVAGAHVVACGADGRTAGGTLTDPDGEFLLRGLDAGSYQVYAAPLDEPVSASNLTSGHEIDIDFESARYPAAANLSDGATSDLGDLFVGDDVSLNLGRSFDRYPRRVIAGLTSLLIIRGTGLNFGSTLEASDPDILVEPLDWVGFQVNFRVTVPADAEAGHVDLTVTDPFGKISILPAALEITPPSPVISNVTPEVGAASGGTKVNVYGSGFQPGCRVVLGDQIYYEGKDSDLKLIDGGHLRISLRSTLKGVHDVVIVDESGVEGRMSSAIQVASIPRVDSVFPTVGTNEGGTELTISGVDFIDGVEVRLGGVLQDEVQRIDSSHLVVVTEPGDAEGETLPLEVSNPGGFADVYDGAFQYVAQPDPVLQRVDPVEGDAEGGEEIELRGANLSAGTVVMFGVDPVTGDGGVVATEVSFEDSSVLRVVTPSHPAGQVAVLALDPETGQKALLAGAYTFTEPPSSGGGCGPIDPRGAASPLSGWRSAAWMLTLLVGLARLRGRAERRLAARGVAPARRSGP